MTTRSPGMVKVEDTKIRIGRAFLAKVDEVQKAAQQKRVQQKRQLEIEEEKIAEERLIIMITKMSSHTANSIHVVDAKNSRLTSISQ